MKSYLEKIRQTAVPILEAAGVTSSAIFGSYVRDEMHEKSDIDFLIDFPREKGLFALIDLELQLKNALGKEVDLVEYDSLKPRIKDPGLYIDDILENRLWSCYEKLSAENSS